MLGILNTATSLMRPDVSDALDKEFDDSGLDWDSMLVAYSILLMVFVAAGASKNHSNNDILEDVEEYITLSGRNALKQFEEWVSWSTDIIRECSLGEQASTINLKSIASVTLLYWKIYDYGAPKDKKAYVGSPAELKDNLLYQIAGTQYKTPRLLTEDSVAAILAGINL